MQCVMSSHHSDQHNYYTITSVLYQYTEVKDFVQLTFATYVSFNLLKYFICS